MPLKVDIRISLTDDKGNDMSYVGKLKVLDLAYNRRETQDKRPLGRNPDTSWCHHHTSVKLFFGRSPWLHGHRRQHTNVLPLSPSIYGL